MEAGLISIEAGLISMEAGLISIESSEEHDVIFQVYRLQFLLEVYLITSKARVTAQIAAFATILLKGKQKYKQ